MTPERPAPEPILPDLLRPGLRLVFCGTAAGRVSAARGAYYAHPHNRFWPTLHEIGLTPRRLDPAEYASLLDWRIGLTDLAKHVAGMDAQLPAGSLGKQARAMLGSRLAAAEPDFLAFTSLAAGRAFLGPNAAFGEHDPLGRTRIWVLPSPSPAAQWNWAGNKHWWFALAAALGRDR